MALLAGSGPALPERFGRAVRRRYPHLAAGRMSYLAEGWDSLAATLDDLIFLFPKRPAVERQLRLQQRLLPALAGRLPLPVPDFQYFSDRPGQSFAGYPRLPGTPLADLPPEAAGADGLLEKLGEFLTVLHSFPVEQARRAGACNMNWQEDGPEPAGPRAALETFYLSLKAEAFGLLDFQTRVEAERQFEAFLDDQANFQYEPVLLHGDFSPDHVLVDPPDGRIRGVIDWGDMAVGDPALDVWETVRPYYRREAGGNFAERRRFYRQLEPFICLDFGLRYGDRALVEYGLCELQAAAPGPA